MTFNLNYNRPLAEGRLFLFIIACNIDYVNQNIYQGKYFKNTHCRSPPLLEEDLNRRTENLFSVYRSLCAVAHVYSISRVSFFVNIYINSNLVKLTVPSGFLAFSDPKSRILCH